MCGKEGQDILVLDSECCGSWSLKALREEIAVGSSGMETQKQIAPFVSIFPQT